MSTSSLLRMSHCIPLVGSDYKDDSLNLMPFFAASCFSGYGDDPKVSYTITIEQPTNIV